MKFFIIVLSALAIGSYFLFASGEPRVELKIGDEAPNFMLEDQDGKKHKLSDYRGEKIVLYYFPKADTPGWTKQACGFRDAFSGYKKENITVFGLSYDSKKSLKAFKKKYRLPFFLLSDRGGKVAKLYGANGPAWAKRMTFIINEKGMIENIYKKINVNSHGQKILDELLTKKD